MPIQKDNKDGADSVSRPKEMSLIDSRRAQVCISVLVVIRLEQFSMLLSVVKPKPNSSL